jgi:iron complex transport system permease protein
MLVGPEHSRLLPASTFMGGIYLLLMDDIARTASSQEIPIGLLTALVGTPIFALVFSRQHGKGWSHD